MEFNEEEIKEIENTAALIPSIARLWNEHKRLNEDAGAKFYKSLHNAATTLGAELDSVSNGTYKKLRLLESDSVVWKRIYSLLKDSGKIRAGLELNKELISGVEKVVKQKEEEEISITDKLANNQKDK